MGFLSPASFYLFAILPLLVLAYLARERPRQAIVSSVLAFRALREMRGERFGGRPRFTWWFFLELLILALAVMALAGPYLTRPAKLAAIVIDNSAPMQARQADGRTRFEAMVAEVNDGLNHGEGNTRVNLYLIAPTPHQAGSFSSPDAAVAELGRIHPTDAPAPPNAITGLVTELLADRHVDHIIVGTYRPFEAPIPPHVSPVVVGTAVPNYAIGSFSITRPNLGTDIEEGHVELGNFARDAAQLTVTIAADGKPVAKAQAQVAPGEVTTLDFANLPAARVYRAQLEPADGFPLDNVAYAVGTAATTFSVLFVSPITTDGLSLRSIPGVTVTTRTPETYTPEDLAGADVVIFEYTTPKELPTTNTLLVMPPPGDPLFNFRVTPSAQLRVTAWPTTDPLTDGVNFRLLNVRSGEYFQQHPWMRTVIAGADGGLLLTGERGGHRFVATGFNPFPYLGRQNLPMSILTLNMLGHLAGFGSQTGIFRTGEPWIVPAGVSTIVLPSGKKLPTTAGAVFTATDEQGVYRLEGPANASTRAVNLFNLNASDLENLAPLKVEAPSAAAPTTAPAVRQPLAAYLLIAILALLTLEGLMVYRARKPLIDA